MASLPNNGLLTNTAATTALILQQTTQCSSRHDQNHRKRLVGITVVQDIGDFVEALRNKAEQMGGKDSYGVKAEHYHSMGVATGYFVDESI